MVFLCEIKAVKTKRTQKWSFNYLMGSLLLTVKVSYLLKQVRVIKNLDSEVKFFPFPHLLETM